MNYKLQILNYKLKNMKIGGDTDSDSDSNEFEDGMRVGVRKETSRLRTED